MIPRILSIIAAETGRSVQEGDTLDLNPLDRICIAVALEEAFNRDIPDSVLESWGSVADVIASVETQGYDA